MKAQTLAPLIKQARSERIVILAGAGVSMGTPVVVARLENPQLNDPFGHSSASETLL